MPIITPAFNCCTVIVTVDAPPGLLPSLEAHARIGITRFAEFPGYIGGALHVSSDHTRLVQYLQWDSESAYQACIDDPSWEDLSSTHEFMEAISAGQVRIDARIFRVAASFDQVQADGDVG